VWSRGVILLCNPFYLLTINNNILKQTKSMKKHLLSIFALLLAVTGAVAQTTYKVSVKEGTEFAA
jgi:hypothetical protein